ncbi:39S ribosomal protein L51, mitochondrial [Stygiomarasmius scandens]|uniref:Large ribosomal subunit protein mL43 n=1 Tax=Marasmiellus scandens TaxID=2682957 RepID=A0ABR1JVY1_9AGAR
MLPLRHKLGSSPANGHSAFLPHIRKLVVEYCDAWPSSHNTRTFLLNHAQSLAAANPHVELVVRQRPFKEPILRAFYVNNRDKVIGLNGLEVTQIQKKAQLLLDSSGAKIKPLKKPVESSTLAARGIFSNLHATRPSL